MTPAMEASCKAAVTALLIAIFAVHWPPSWSANVAVVVVAMLALYIGAIAKRKPAGGRRKALVYTFAIVALLGALGGAIVAR